MQRLHDAQADGQWKIGVKADQPYLSEEKGGHWSGREIDYAKAITKSLGIPLKNIKWVPIGTKSRPDMLSDQSVDMIVGTYGMSTAREKGNPKDHTEGVLFAGPYFQTTERIMMQADPKHHGNAVIHGKSETVHSLDDLIAAKARVCVASGSTADTYLEENNEFPDRARLSDYDLCVTNLKGKYDAMITDTTILDLFQKKNPGAYTISRDILPIGSNEEYAVGLNKNATTLKELICEKMKTKEVTDATRRYYKNIPGGSPMTGGCQPPPD
ncbi:transporter substrate-binding domain-containing protein [Streptomyces sp. 8L]|uniref:transporter substrate-binding domain-containing protein n=1 Tax=Streptomyces sp. 8L TaxID=2877242 RepID=UPI001CD6B8DA|nr:transporter substrate-binding domain-containing protein [Streptomyces sp. 8L]MCA1224362.1 transporter substrate-binding domain-containing protein [Streptomyces sp. 8L]